MNLNILEVKKEKKMKYKKIKHKLGFYQVEPMPTKEELKKYYEKVYFQNSKGSYTPTYTSSEKTYFMNEGIASEYLWKKFTKKDKGRIFDVGCGEGFFSRYFQEIGWNVECCDFSSYGIKTQNPSLLKHFMQGDIDEILDNKISKKEKYELINLGNVLEHVLNPLELLDKLKKLMNKNSLLRIKVPNDFSKFQMLLLERKCIKDSWFAPPDHLNYFTFDSLKNVIIGRKFNINKMLADFPNEVYLSNKYSNYDKDKKKGKECHNSRVLITNFLFEQGVDKYIKYMEAAGNCGFGRTITAFVSIK